MAPTLQRGNPIFGRFASRRGNGRDTCPRGSVSTINNTLRRTEAFAVDKMLARGQRRLAAAQATEDGGILNWQVDSKGFRGAGVSLASAADAVRAGRCLDTR